MKFLLTGVETKNKGAELMLYAILQEIERKHPNSEVYLERRNAYLGGYTNIKTSLSMKIVEHPLNVIIKKTKFNSILRLLHMCPCYIVPDIPRVDYVLDGSGLHFSDKMNVRGSLGYWRRILEKQHNLGAKIIFLPQAFGPINLNATKKGVSIMSKYADLICARERVSYDFLEESACVDMKKVKIFSDFTILANGIFPNKYGYLRHKVCIIPNSQMIDKGVMSQEAYLSYLYRIIEEVRSCGYDAFLLNHQGSTDKKLLDIIRKQINDIECVTGLDALETKGIISGSYLVITSRFHGLASALNSARPSLATSWSHKYQCLFEDYGQNDCVLSLTDIDADLNKIRCFLSPEYNNKIHNELNVILPKLKKNTINMWNTIWSL